jgi:hypothetical protein
MAITMIDYPELWSPRGQKLMFVADSDETSQDGFQYGFEVENQTTGKIYLFMIPPNIGDNYGYFDLASCIAQQNAEVSDLRHKAPIHDPYIEPDGSGWSRYGVTVKEYWKVAGILTPSGIEEYTFSVVFNAYYQQKYGYKPDVNGNNEVVSFTANDEDVHRWWSDRFTNTHLWELRQNFDDTAGTIMIPCFTSDWGTMAQQYKDVYFKSSELAEVRLTFFYGDIYNQTNDDIDLPLPLGTAFFHAGCYPQNLNASQSQGVPCPATYPNWTHYIFSGIKSTGNRKAVTREYCFYNAARFGQSDCKHDRVRIAWVSSRGGYDYFNFIKRNEYTTQIERKPYQRTLFNQTDSIFRADQRIYIDQTNLARQTLLVTSDWIQENEFVFLRNLLVSNQVSIINNDGTSIPASIEDSTYTETRARNGKLVNLTLRIKVAYDYWT